MNDQTIPADKVRAWVTAWETTRPEHRTLEDAEGIIQALRDLLPPPLRPTLADMPMEEWDECQWMQADLNGYGSRVVILNPGWDDGSARVMWMHTRIGVVPHRDITPRPDLPRMEWPGNKKADPAPTPALPDGWRLADHEDHGRVIVTNTTPDPSGHVCYVLPAEDYVLGYDWNVCDPDELTYLDQEVDQ